MLSAIARLAMLKVSPVLGKAICDEIVEPMIAGIVRGLA